MKAIFQRLLISDIKFPVNLLTDTAVTYIEKKGYLAVSGNDTSSAIQRGTQFSELCPASVKLIRKRLFC